MSWFGVCVWMCACVCARDVLRTQRATVPLKLATFFTEVPFFFFFFLVRPALVCLLISPCDERSRHIKWAARVSAAYRAYGELKNTQTPHAGFLYSQLLKGGGKTLSETFLTARWRIRATVRKKERKKERNSRVLFERGCDTVLE